MKCGIQNDQFSEEQLLMFPTMSQMLSPRSRKSTPNSNPNPPKMCGEWKEKAYNLITPWIWEVSETRVSELHGEERPIVLNKWFPSPVWLLRNILGNSRDSQKNIQSQYVLKFDWVNNGNACSLESSYKCHSAAVQVNPAIVQRYPRIITAKNSYWKQS
jgi:hypothetical protein